nr:hypothetical protein CFP56_38357 [Quercus suber]
MRNVQLLLEENKSVQTTLWGNTAQQIDDDLYETNKGPFIVIVTSTIVKTFRGDYQLSSTFATKLYVNLDIPEVAEIRNKTQWRKFLCWLKSWPLKLVLASTLMPDGAVLKRKEGL